MTAVAGDVLERNLPRLRIERDGQEQGAGQIIPDRSCTPGMHRPIGGGSAFETPTAHHVMSEPSAPEQRRGRVYRLSIEQGNVKPRIEAGQY